MPQAWKVNLNDCEWTYVFAGTQDEAIEAGKTAWEDITGQSWGRDWDGDEPVSVDRRADLDGSAFTYRQLVEAGDAHSAGCEGIDLDESHTHAYLTTEW